MTGFADILRDVDVSGATHPSNGFVARRIAERSNYLSGRDAAGFPCMLVATTGAGRTVPLRLADIEVRFSVPCLLQELGHPERTETFTVIVCTTRDSLVQKYFCNIADLLTSVLGPSPTLSATAEAVSHVADMFQKLRDPPREAIVGLVGELCVLAAAENVTAAVRAWRVGNAERFDFACGSLRLEVKASTGGRRLHSISLDQADPPLNTIGFLASVLVERTGGGTSVEELAEIIEHRVLEQADVLRFRSVLAETLGSDLLTALDWRFDLHRAQQSLAFFDVRAIPAIRRPIPTGVSEVRFVSNLDGQQTATPSDLQRLDALQRSIFPP